MNAHKEVRKNSEKNRNRGFPLQDTASRLKNNAALLDEIQRVGADRCVIVVDVNPKKIVRNEISVPAANNCNATALPAKLQTALSALKHGNVTHEEMASLVQTPAKAYYVLLLDKSVSQEDKKAALRNLEKLLNNGYANKAAGVLLKFITNKHLGATEEDPYFALKAMAIELLGKARRTKELYKIQILGNRYPERLKSIAFDHLYPIVTSLESSA